MSSWPDYLVIIVYFAVMIAVGFLGVRRARSTDDFLVAGRRLGHWRYASTLSAVVLGGASTIGGVRLGYKYGISGMWMVFWLGAGIVLLGAAFSPILSRLRVYTVAEMMERRHDGSSRLISGLIMAAYDLMVTVTATIAIGTVFSVLLGISSSWAILLGGGVVVAYSVLGGMWSITLTDIIQFVVMTVGMFLLFLPLAISKAGGWSAMWDKAPSGFTSIANMGGSTIWTYFLLFFFGIMIGQDIWQRVFTAKSVSVARWGGVVAGLYCIAYAIAGALIGTGIRVLLPNLTVPDNAFAEGAKLILPVGVTGLVLAAALAAIMSTASACLMASSTILANDVVVRFILRRTDQRATLLVNRVFLLSVGVAVIIVSLVIKDVVGGLTVAYDMLVGALVVPIVGALFWKRATTAGAVSAMVIGTVVMVVMMAVRHDLYTNDAITYSLVASLVTYIGVSLATPKPSAEKLEEWAEATGEGSGAPQVPPVDAGAVGQEG